MDSGFYDTGIEGILDQSLSWARDELRVCLLRKGYAFKPEHTTLADLAQFAAGFSSPLTGARVTRRDLVADDTHVLATKEAPLVSLAVYRPGRTTGDSRLVLFSFMPEIKPLVGQRVEVPWPAGIVASF